VSACAPVEPETLRGHPPPDPRRPRGARRAAEPPIDAGPREPGHGTRPTPVRRHHDLRVRTAPPPTPRDHAGTFGVRGGPTAAAPRSPPASAGPGAPARTAGRTARAAHRRGGGRAVARSPVLARQRTGAYTPPTPIEFPIAPIEFPIASLHHPGVGDRPDPRAPPDPRRARGARRGAEPPINAGRLEPGGVTRPTPVRRRSAGHLSTARRPATTRGPSAWAAVPPARRMGSRRHRSPRRARRSHGPRGHERVNGHAATRQSVLVRPVIARPVIAPYTRRIVDPPRLKFLSQAAA
jgi:hypothetical protein